MKRGWWLVFFAGILSAEHPALQCGTYPGRPQEEIFLHRQHASALKKRKLTSAAQTNRDFGQIAVIDDSGGVIDRRNPFNLDRTTVVFSPVTGGYSVALAGDTFDTVASAAGTKLDGLGDDDSRAAAIPFPFRFYGVLYQKIWINSNGYLTFTAGDTDASGSYGHFAAGLPAIAPLFTDLDPSQSGAAVRVLAETGRLVVTFAGVPLYNSSDYAIPPIENFQVRLYPDGRIEIAYRSTNPPDAVVGITPGNLQPVSLVDLSAAGSGAFSGGIADIFASSSSVDIAAAAQKFYQTHDDAYDYLVFYNAGNVAAGPGVVAYESTVRSTGTGYGDTVYDYGPDFGSARRLQAVLNLGPISEYPGNPSASVPARGITGDTSLTILGHEAGHLYLALVSVPNPSNPNASPPMLGRALVHWAFTFNSEASFLEGNRIADSGAGASPRFSTTATVQGYSPLDQYLLGFRAPEEVPPMFAVLNSGLNPMRPPQDGVGFNGDRLDITIDDIIRAAGRRTPDSTVAQRRFRFAIVLIVPAGSVANPNDVAQVEGYRSEFEAFFASAAAGRASADTTLKRGVALSLFPNAGVVAGANGTASLTLASPATAPLSFTLQAPGGFLMTPQTVTIPAGASRAAFQVTGNALGVEEFAAVPSDPAHETAYARVQVLSSAASLHLGVVSGDKQAVPLASPVVLRAVDRNNLPYSGVRVIAQSSAGGTVQPASAITDERGSVSFLWTPGGSDQLTANQLTANQLTAMIEGVPSSAVRVTAMGPPVIFSNGVVNGASFQPGISTGGFVTLFGTNLAAGASAAATSPFPMALAGVQVTMNGTLAPIISVSDGQVNILAPANLPPGPVDIVVQTALGVSAPANVQLNSFAPGIFSDNATGYAAIQSTAGAALLIYCTGIGPQPQARISGADATVLSSGVTSIPGLYQVSVQVRNGTPAGAQSLTLTINGIVSNTVRVLLASGS